MLNKKYLVLLSNRFLEFILPSADTGDKLASLGDFGYY